MTEKQIQAQIMQYLDACGIVNWKIFTTGIPDVKSKVGFRKNPSKGISDIQGVIPPLGRHLAIEVKTKVGVVSPEQTAHIERVLKCGGVAFVARSLDDVIEGLRFFNVMDRTGSHAVNRSQLPIR
jgi:hypothetical protein